ncbi:MAG: hypothetical protein ABI352_12375 [Candidatus Dormibacter sp.]
MIGVVVALTALLGSLVPSSLHGFAILVVLLLAGLDIALIRSTDALAFAYRRTLDERERALRDVAYRRGFRLLGLAFAVEVLILIVTGILSYYVNGNAHGLGTAVVDTGITGRALVGMLEALLMLPTVVIAWVDPDQGADETPATPRRQWLAWLTLPAVAVVWLVLVAIGPEQAAAASRNHSSSFSVQGATCAPFAAGRIVDAEFGATVGMRVGVCWNGHDAFVFGDPTIPLPPSAIAGMGVPAGLDIGPGGSNVNPSQSDITACGADNLDDFATVSATDCTGVIDSGGILHYSVHAHVSAPLGIGQRNVTLTLVIDRNGHVLERP